MERPANEAPGKYRTGTSSATGTTTARRWAILCDVAGRIPLPPRFAFGVWWSRYWAYSDQELDELVRGFRENDTPLDVLVIDMDWHINQEQLKAMGEKDQSGRGWAGPATRGTSCCFPIPMRF